MSKSHWNWTSAPCWFKLTIFCITAITTVKITWGGFACLENPCMHGICIDYLDVNSSSNCYCLNGYTGFHCQINWDECFHLNPCLNGGSCSDGIASFNCSCPENFAGALCQYDLSACGEICHNNASCTIDSSSGNETISCLCQPGFVGSQCEVDVSICNTTENACLNGGQCKDGIGESFQCQCEPGWEGDVCQKQIDNCAPSPCSSGGVCVNKLNDFACACPFGYTGKVCEKKLKICEVNPCKNGAFCLHEDEDESKKTCYCVPDYGGDLCEFKYDDCSPAPRCDNGGTCIDGVGAFSCSCMPNFFGPTCQCTAENMTEPECQFNETTTTIHPASVYFTHSATFSSEKVTTKLPEQSELMSGILPETIITSLPPQPSSITTEGGDSSTTTFATVILSSASEPALNSDSILSIDSAKPYPVSSTVILPMESSTIIDGTEPSISLDASEGLISPSSLMSLFPTPILSRSSISVSEPKATESLMSEGGFVSIGVLSTLQTITPGDLHSASDYWMSASSLKLPEVEHSSSTTKPDNEITESPTISNIFSTATGSFSSIMQPLSTIISVPLNTTQNVLVSATPVPTTSTDLTSTEVVTEPTISYEFSTVDLESAYSTISLSNLPPFTTTFSSDVELLSPTINTSQITPYSSITPTLSHTLPPISPIVTDSIFHISTLAPDYTTTTMIDADSPSSLLFTPVSSTEVLVNIDTSIMEGSTTIFPQSSLISLSTSIIPDVTPSSIYLTTPQTSLSVSSPSPSPATTPPPPTVSTANTSQTEDPCQNFCNNNGKCISDSIQPICICSFKFSGDRCEIPREPFKTVSFTGNSFLEYKVPNDSGSRINVQTMMATNSPDAILFYTASSRGRLYALIFTTQGSVNIHFSCGEQSMHFVETRTRVDTGHNFTLEFSMEMVVHAAINETEVHCIGEVRVNHSFIMRGEQIVGHNKLTENPIQFIYLGGVDTTKENAKKTDDLISIMPGFRGCAYSLEINGESRDLFEDAMHGQQVGSCSAFGCVTNPCYGGSTCVPSNKFPFWECICNSGFQGDRCHVRVCDSNPCQNGATCTWLLEEINEISNSTKIIAPHPQPKCLCSLGFTGSQCQSSLNITKPSFTPFSGFDYSAYIAYEPIPRFADWVQLKLHFVIKNHSQIALLLYSGYTQSLTTSAVSNPDDIDALAELLKEGASIGEDDLASSANNNEVGYGNQKVSDFFAITYVHGFIALTWNLGSGTQRIISSRRIDKKINVHTLFAGRSGRQAWLKVDGMRNVTGKSPGPFHRLNVNTELFIGGYEGFRFEGLPHDLPLHKGFSGCIFDFGFRVKQRLYLPKPLRGRNVKNCYEEDC